MGIFDGIKKHDKNKTTKGFYFGHTEAEGENKQGLQNLDHYFEDYLEVLSQILDEKFIVVGRKGSGKSAIAKFIKDTSDKDQDSFCDLIKYNDIEVEALVQSIPSGERKNIELIIFEWLILVRLIKMFSKNEYAKYTNEFKKFNDFINRNSGFVAIDKFHITEVVEKKKLEVQIEVLKHVFGPTIGKYVDAKQVKAPFYTFINPLKEIIEKVAQYDVFKEKEFIILFDDLDIKFKVNSTDSTEKLLGLIRAAKNLNTTIFRNTKIKVILFLRDDIKRALMTCDSDTSKLFTSYCISLDWYDHDSFKTNENAINLKKFINRRIALNFDSNNVNYNKTDPWYNLFIQQASYGKSSFKYILDFTFYRPRDLVLFLLPIGRSEGIYPIDHNSIKTLLKKYLVENVNEIKSELKIYFDDQTIVKIFLILKTIASKGFKPISKEQVLEIISQQELNIDSTQILELLLSYSLLTYIDSNSRLYFSYRINDYSIADFDSMNLTLHKCIYNYYYPDQL